MGKTDFHPVTGFVRTTGCTALSSRPTFSGAPRGRGVGSTPFGGRPSGCLGRGRRPRRVGRLVGVSGAEEEVGGQEHVLVSASSLSNSSELGDSSQETKLAWGNSRPMTGVTSKLSY